MVKKDDILEAINAKSDEIEKESDEFADELDDEFQKVVNNPTPRRKRAFKEAETILIAGWADKTYRRIVKPFKEYADIGSQMAAEQLLAKGFKKKHDYSKEKDEFTEGMKELVREQIGKMNNSMVLNARRDMSKMQEAPFLGKKKISQGVVDTFEEYGLAYFNDARGAKWSAGRYSKMVSFNTAIAVIRNGLMITSLEFDNDLVKVWHLGESPECDLCAPFNGKVLSITGRTPGYMTVDEASRTGHLFGYNCDHFFSVELAPEKEDDDNLIALTPENLRIMSKQGFEISEVKKEPYFKK